MRLSFLALLWVTAFCLMGGVFAQFAGVIQNAGNNELANIVGLSGLAISAVTASVFAWKMRNFA